MKYDRQKILQEIDYESLGLTREQANDIIREFTNQYKLAMIGEDFGSIMIPYIGLLWEDHRKSIGVTNRVIAQTKKGSLDNEAAYKTLKRIIDGEDNPFRIRIIGTKIARAKDLDILGESSDFDAAFSAAKDRAYNRYGSSPGFRLDDEDDLGVDSESGSSSEG